MIQGQRAVIKMPEVVGMPLRKAKLILDARPPHDPTASRLYKPVPTRGNNPPSFVKGASGYLRDWLGEFSRNCH